ncbi:unnamed protein product [Phaeothamnion confervicola]
MRCTQVLASLLLIVPTRIDGLVVCLRSCQTRRRSRAPGFSFQESSHLHQRRRQRQLNSRKHARTTMQLEEGDLDSLEGGLFPSAEKARVRLAPMRDTKEGQPQQLVGFWDMQSSSLQDGVVADRIILRADGQIMGGPVVSRQTTSWSDPDGLRACGGNWEVKSGDDGRSKMLMRIFLTRARDVHLDFTGNIVAMDDVNNITGEARGVLRVFGDCTLRAERGFFSMEKVTTEDMVLIPSVGFAPAPPPRGTSAPPELADE